jgi:hypothetical protein
MTRSEAILSDSLTGSGLTCYLEDMNTNRNLTLLATPEFTAIFPKMAMAVSYAKALTEPGRWASNVVRKGRTVTFNSAIPGTASYESRTMFFQDTLENVGYYGSPPQGPVATLNGVKAPRSY